ncbi:MAG: ABC transporter permease [Candidatus Humimicrobiaceae bacterium]
MELENSKIGSSFFRGVLNNIVWIIFILIIVIFSITIQGFFSKENFINIIYHSVFIGILAIAETYVLISGNMDLSIESTAACSAIISVWLTASSPYASGLMLNTGIGLFVALAIGVAVGAFNAFFIVKLKINSFLVTLSSYIFVRAIGIWITGGMGMNDLPKSFRFIDVFRIFDIPLMVFLMVILYVVFEFVLKRTVFGKHLFIIGGNTTAAFNFGINVNGIIYKTFILSGVIAGLAGWLIAARANGSTSGLATGYLFEVLAAVVIGGVSLSGGVGSLVGVFAGTLVLGSIHSALNITAVSPFITDVIRGLLIIFAVSLDSLKRLFKK